jgi:hypothetical protein
VSADVAPRFSKPFSLKKCELENPATSAAMSRGMPMSPDVGRCRHYRATMVDIGSATSVDIGSATSAAMSRGMPMSADVGRYRHYRATSAGIGATSAYL